MARDYDKVLRALGAGYDVIGRGEASSAAFEEQTGGRVLRGGVERHLESGVVPPARAIVCVGVEHLALTASALIASGVRHILVEKPAGMSPEEIVALHVLAHRHDAVVTVGYNRRFYASVNAAKALIAEDGGATSFTFEFTEWSHVIRGVQKAPGVKEQWFLCNSSHVVDLAFFLGGTPREITCYTAGSLDWHPTAAAYAGAGVTEHGAVFSYHADWAAPGRWSVEVCTRAHRLVLRPLETLQVQMLESVAVVPVPIDDALDRQFKPGLYVQTSRFLEGRLEDMCTLAQQYTRLPIYSRMAGREVASAV